MIRIVKSLTGGAALAFAVAAVSVQGTEPASEIIAPDAGIKAPQQAEPRDPLAETAAWLSQQSDERPRAAGLLYRLSMMGRVQAARSGDEATDAASTIDEFEHAIRTTTDGAALAWLALACESADVRKFCIAQGLDDAIVAHDGANFFSRISLRKQPDVEQTRRLLLDSTVRRTYEPERVAVWHAAMQRYDWREALETQRKALETQGVELSDAPVSELSLALLAGFSSFSSSGGLIEACGTEIDITARWVDACGEIAAEMAEHGRTAYHRFLGLTLLQKRAEAMGDPERAASHAADLRARQNHFSCIAWASSAIDGTTDETLQRDYLKWLERDGEIGALERLAELAELDCSNPPDARTEALRRAGVDSDADS